MKRVIIVAIALAVLLPAGMAFADEFEIGMSFTPLGGAAEKGDEEGEMEGMPGFHFGYAFWGIFYTSLDALVAPPSMIEDMTSYRRPGFINLFGAGVRLHLGPFVGFTTLGVNTLYIHDQASLQKDGEEFNPDLGANMRLGLGYHGDWFGITATGTQTFDSTSSAVRTIGGLFDAKQRPGAVNRLVDGLIPSLMLVLYL
ncbi:MAG: hypothetical protein ACLFR1_04095 [Spirochaetia bacterium]